LINLGIIGLNEGNGHPYSYSSIINGFDNKKLQSTCPFQLIKDYLPLGAIKYGTVKNAKVTHIWSQNKKKSREIAEISFIENIVDSYDDMIGQVDGVILARDDPWNHLIMAEPFLKNQVPIFIDKQLTSNAEDLLKFIKLAEPFNKFMACSPIRYNPKLLNLDMTSLKKNMPRVIHGISRVNWLRYGHHLFEGVVKIFGYDVNSVQIKKKAFDHESVQISYRSGLTIHFDFISNISLPIYLTIYSEKESPIKIEFDDFYLSFKIMLENFTNFVETGVQPIKIDEIISIAKIIVAGQISKINNGISVDPNSILD